jgi:hypothetical protein
MIKSVLLSVVCATSSFACDVSCREDCDWSDDCSEQHRSSRGGGNTGGSSGGMNASAGTSATGNQLGGSASSGETGGTASSAGRGSGSKPGSTRCDEESDCDRGYNCDYERKECVPAGAETCLELTTEVDCDNRNDCISIYAGVSCSCGPQCTCIGGEPGCVCQSFEFFTCEPLAG